MWRLEVSREICLWIKRILEKLFLRLVPYKFILTIKLLPLLLTIQFYVIGQNMLRSEKYFSSEKIDVGVIY